MRKLLIVFILLIATPLFAANPYWVDDNGDVTTKWANCQSADPLSGAAACTLSTANTNAAAGNTVYLRAGTYTTTGHAINPTNSGTSGNVITFSGYEDENVIIAGAADLTGYNSRAINLDGDSYIKVTKITFTNMHTYLWMNNSTYNEISYCTFKDNRNSWNDVIVSGTAENDADHYFQSASVLYDSGGFGTLPVTFRVYNATDKSVSYNHTSSTATTITSTSYPLVGGTNNYWSNGDEYQITYTYSWAPSYIKTNSNHNWIHHNTFYNMGAYSPDHDEGVGLQVGVESVETDIITNNTIEDNHLYAAGHHVLGVNNCKNCVVRNNYVHNEGWYSADPQGICATRTSGGCGYRVFSCSGHVDNSGYSLFENNRIGYGAIGGYALHADFDVIGGGSGSGVTLSIPNNIYRYNDHFYNALYGLRLGASVGTAGHNNRIYNNTFYKNGWITDNDPHALDSYRNAISFYGDTCAKISGTVVKNNLFHDHWSVENKTGVGYTPSIDMINATVRDTCDPLNVVTNNYTDDSSTYLYGYATLTDSADPKFVDADLSDPSSLTKPDLSLGSDSPAIDGGTYLTQVNDADGCDADTADCTALVVDDSTYFQDGTWGSALATLTPDEICISASADATDLARCRAISSIDYETHTITLATEITFSNNEYVWLYKKSDGAQVLYGNKSDYGAHEYNSESSSTLTITKSGSGTGTVTSDVVGIDCGSTCTYDYDGTVVTLTATATSPSYFSGWSGEGCSDTGTCQVTMSAAKAVTATFSRYGVGTIGAGGQITFGAGGSMTLQ